MMDKSRVRDLATLLPWTGVFLFAPPVLFLFRPSATLFGIPLLLVYLFTVWLVLILASQQLTKHLVEEQDQASSANPPASSSVTPSDIRPS